MKKEATLLCASDSQMVLFLLNIILTEVKHSIMSFQYSNSEMLAEQEKYLKLE